MKIPWPYKRYLIFVGILLLVLPLIFSFFIKAASFSLKLRTVFLLQKFYVITAVLILVLLMVSSSKTKEFKPSRKKYQAILLGSISVILFILAFHTQADIDRNVSPASSFTDRLHFDSGRLLAWSALADSDVNPSKRYSLDNPGDRFIKEVTIQGELERPTVVWNTARRDWNSSDNLSGCKVILGIGEEKIDVTQQYLAIENGKNTWLQASAEGNLSPGKHNLSLQKDCKSNIVLNTQETYINHLSAIEKEGAVRPLPMDEFVIFVQQDNGLPYEFLFKMGFILRIIAAGLLFASIFGIDFIALLLKKAKLEIFFSFVYSLIMYWFASFVQQQWYLLSKTVTYATYFLLKISFLKPVVSFSNPEMPLLGVPDLVIGMADTCSGIESMGYFILAYSIFIAINWKQIDMKKSLVAFIPGLLGTILVNILRVYLLFLIAIFISKDFAVNIYHTNAAMLLFIIYFLSYWGLVSKHIMTRPEKRDSQNKQDINMRRDVKQDRGGKKA